MGLPRTEGVARESEAGWGEGEAGPQPERQMSAPRCGPAVASSYIFVAVEMPMPNRSSLTLVPEILARK
jgi:hypothetical protein